MSRVTSTESGAVAGGVGGVWCSPFPDGSLGLGSERLRERGTTIDRVVLLEREEPDLVLFRMLGREDVVDMRLDLDDRRLWLEIWRGMGLDSCEGVEVFCVEVNGEEE